MLNTKAKLKLKQHGNRHGGGEKTNTTQATMIAHEKLDSLNIFKFLTFTRNPLCDTIANAKMREAE